MKSIKMVWIIIAIFIFYPMQSFSADYKLDHFKIYSVQPIEKYHDTELKGQFDTESKPPYKYKIKGPVGFGNPTMKNDEDINNKHAHFSVYRLNPVGFNWEPRYTVRVANQFDSDFEIRIGSPVFMLQPARKIEKDLEFPKRLLRYKCYDVFDCNCEERICGCKPGEVNIKDQFDSQPYPAELISPRLFCVPEGKENQEHLLIYPFTQLKKYPLEIKIDDKLYNGILRGLMAEALAVPTKKIKWSQTK